MEPLLMETHEMRTAFFMTDTYSSKQHNLSNIVLFIYEFLQSPLIAYSIICLT